MGRQAVSEPVAVAVVAAAFVVVAVVALLLGQ